MLRYIVIVLCVDFEYSYYLCLNINCVIKSKNKSYGYWNISNKY